MSLISGCFLCVPVRRHASPPAWRNTRQPLCSAPPAARHPAGHLCCATHSAVARCLAPAGACHHADSLPRARTPPSATSRPRMGPPQHRPAPGRAHTASPSSTFPVQTQGTFAGDVHGLLACLSWHEPCCLSDKAIAVLSAARAPQRVAGSTVGASPPLQLAPPVVVAVPHVLVRRLAAASPLGTRGKGIAQR